MLVLGGEGGEVSFYLTYSFTPFTSLDSLIRITSHFCDSSASTVSSDGLGFLLTRRVCSSSWSSQQLQSIQKVLPQSSQVNLIPTIGSALQAEHFVPDE